MDKKTEKENKEVELDAITSADIVRTPTLEIISEEKSKEDTNLQDSDEDFIQ